MKKGMAIGLIVVLALLLAPAASVAADNGSPTLPHQFYGTVKIRTTAGGTNNDAPAGTQVAVMVDEVMKGSLVTDVVGKYGGPTLAEGKLIVQNIDAEGTELKFYIDGYLADTPPGGWPGFDSGAIDELNLTAYVPPPGVGGGGGGVLRRYYIDTNLLGIEESYLTNRSGEILETIEATSEDGILTLTIPDGTIALDEDGNRLGSLEVTIDESPPEPPEDAYIIGLAYSFGPGGATFDPPITLEYTYDPADIPEGVAAEDLVLAFYDEVAGEWIELVCVVDTVNNTITASVSHFTTFAIIGAVTPPTAAFTVSSLSISPATVNIGETVTISLVVTNTGGKSGSYIVTLDINGVKEADETVTVAAGDSQEVSFSVTKEDAGIYSVAVAELTGSFTVAAPGVFSVSDLSLQPTQVKPGEAVTISASVANTGSKPGSYTVVLKIDGVKEAEKTVTIAAGESLDVSFSVTKEEADTYTVTVDGLSGSFTVVAPVVVPLAKPGINWPLIGGIIGGVIVVGLGVFFWMRRRAY